MAGSLPTGEVTSTAGIPRAELLAGLGLDPVSDPWNAVIDPVPVSRSTYWPRVRRVTLECTII